MLSYNNTEITTNIKNISNKISEIILLFIDVKNIIIGTLKPIIPNMKFPYKFEGSKNDTASAIKKTEIKIL